LAARISGAITILAVLEAHSLALTEHPAAQLVVPAGQFCQQTGPTPAKLVLQYE